MVQGYTSRHPTVAFHNLPFWNIRHFWILYDSRLSPFKLFLTAFYNWQSCCFLKDSHFWILLQFFIIWAEVEPIRVISHCVNAFYNLKSCCFWKFRSFGTLGTFVILYDSGLSPFKLSLTVQMPFTISNPVAAPPTSIHSRLLASSVIEPLNKIFHFFPSEFSAVLFCHSGVCVY